MTITPTPRYRVKLGRTVATSNAVAAVEEELISSVILRHSTGDWGDLDAEDYAMNDAVMEDPNHDGRLFSSYKNVPFRDGSTGKLWVITDAPETPEAITTVLLPEDY
jgi:hypothetical protein